MVPNVLSKLHFKSHKKNTFSSGTKDLLKKIQDERDVLRKMIDTIAEPQNKQSIKRPKMRGPGRRSSGGGGARASMMQLKKLIIPK